MAVDRETKRCLQITNEILYYMRNPKKVSNERQKQINFVNKLEQQCLRNRKIKRIIHDNHN